MAYVNYLTRRRRDPRSNVPPGPRDPRAGMNRPAGPGPMPTTQPGPPPQVMPSGLPPASSAATSAAIGRALGAGTSDQEKVSILVNIFLMSPN